MELIINPVNPLVITGNFIEIKAQLLEGIKKYEIEVTEENLKEAKTMATELNKLSTVINKVKSEKVSEISAPIEAFKAQVAELVDICQAGRTKILEQVKKLEAVTLEKCKELLEDEFNGQMNEKGIRQEFRISSVADLVGLSALTDSGKLTKGAKEKVATKVAEIRMLQDKVDMRLMQLENSCLKAGLKSPLQKAHVEAFLNLPDDQYEIKLSQIIGIEVSRQANTEKVVIQEQEQKRLRFFRCAVCIHVVTATDLPEKCPSCPSKAFQEFPSLNEAKAAREGRGGNPLPPPPLPPTTPRPAPSMPQPLPTLAPVLQINPWNQERLRQMRQHLGDEVFFQMFKIVYMPISDRAINDRIVIDPTLIQAIEWAKGTD